MEYNYTKMGLLPYQVQYINNKSQFKLVEKSRQIGMTRTQALEDVLDAGIDNLYDVYFSSNNDLNAKEYIRYCRKFAEVFKLVLKDVQNIELIQEESHYSIEFTNGRKITAVSSNPNQLHGKSGKIVLDEFARRNDQIEVWEAAYPAASIWNKPIRIISTHNGKNTLFYKFIENILKGELDWYHQKTTIEDAVNQGIADKVKGKTLTKKEKEEYLYQLKKNVANTTIWQQQFMCIAQDEAEAFMPYALLEKNAKAELLPFKQLEKCNTLYAGLDVGRYKNLSVLWIIEAVSSYHFITRFIRTIKNTDFPKQEQIISEFLNLPNLRRLCIDKTGLGIGLVDYLQKRHGKSWVEGVTLTAQTKENIAFRVQKYFHDTAFHIPNTEDIKNDFHSVKQDTTSSGNIRLRADTNEETGSHADYFWAACLSLEAGVSTPHTEIKIHTLPKNLIDVFYNGLLKGFKK